MSLFDDQEQSVVKNGFIVQDYMKNEKTYNGTTEKFGITVQGDDYIVKFAKDEELTCYTEYIASRLMQGLGINAHTVFLGKYCVEGEYETVCILRDFTDNCHELHAYKDTKQSSEDTDIGAKEYTYDDIIYMISKHTKLSESVKQRCLRQFWEMYVADAIIGNRDRHWGNWGYLINNDGIFDVAPIYDNGSSLFPGIAKQIHKFPSLEFMYERIYVFPASLFKVKRPDRTYRSNYYEIIRTAEWPLLQSIVDSIKNRFSWCDIIELAYSIIAPLAVNAKIKEFWVEIICLRYRCIICDESLDSVYEEVREYYGKLCKK